MPSLKTITFEHVPVMFKHFSGHPRPFNQYDREGGRSFDIRLDPEQFDDDAIKQMEQDELRVSQWVPKNGGDPIWHLPVNCSFTDSNGARVKVPPRFYIIEGDNVTELAEDNVEMLDSVRIAWADIEVNPWRRNEARPYSCYMRSGYFCIQQSELDKKYAKYIHEDNGEYDQY